MTVYRWIKIILVAGLLFCSRAYSQDIITDLESENTPGILNEEFRKKQVGIDDNTADITTNTTNVTTNTAAIAAISDVIVQRVSASLSTPVDVTATLTQDDTSPLYSEGDLITSLVITPTSATNKIEFSVNLWGAISGLDTGLIYVTTGTGSSEALAIRGGYDNAKGLPIMLIDDVVAGTTSALTFYVLGGVVSGGTFYVGRDASGTDLYGSANFGSIILREIKV